jgi:tetratricopeptide (TPR) repeat protein
VGLAKNEGKERKLSKNVGTGAALEVKFFSMNKVFNRYRVVLICIFLAVATLAAYWQVLHSDFVNLDDPGYVTENRYVNTGFTWENIKWAFSVGKIAYWHPLTWVSHILDCQLYGLRAGLHHLTNLIIHIANTLLLFGVLKRLTGAVWRSAFVAAVFALHPINVDSVAWVTERKSVLSALFWLLTMWVYTDYAQRGGVWRYLITLLLFALGLLAKPMLVTLPFVMLLLDYWPLGRFIRHTYGGFSFRQNLKSRISNSKLHSGASSAFQLVIEKIPFFAISAVSVYLSLLSAQRLGITISTQLVPIKLRIANALVSYVGYIGKLIWPRKLAVFYPYPENVATWESAGALVILLCATIVLLVVFRRRPYLGMGWLWYVGTLVPVIGLVQAGLWPAMADRWAYVPMIGLAILTAWGVGDIAAKWRLRGPVLIFAASTCLSVLLVCTWLQAGYWHNSFTLLTRALNVTSGNYIAHLNLGNVYIKEKKTDEAIRQYKEAIEIYNNYADAHYNLGIALGLQGKHDEAIKEYYTVLRLKEDYWKARFHLADALAKTGRLDEAISHYQKIVQLHLYDAEVYNNFAMALVKKGKINEAIEYYNKCLEINPASVEVLNNLGNALLEQGEFGRAVAHFKKALSLKPSFAETHYNLANVLRQMGQIDEAAVYYREALQLIPDNVDAYYGLGLVLTQQKKYDEAITHFRKAIQLNPDFAQAYYNLGTIFAEQNEIGKAIEQFRQVLRIYPNDAQMHYNLGILLLRDGRVDEAINEFRAALQIDPNLPEARKQLEAALARKAIPTPQ